MVALLIWAVFFWCCFWDDLEWSELDYIPWEVIVKYKDVKISKQSLRNVSVMSTMENKSDFDNLEIKEQLDDSENVVLMEITDDKSVEEMVEVLAQDSNIEYVEPNYIRYLFSMDDFPSSDLWKSQQWWLDYISWEDWYNTYSWRLLSNWIKVWVIDNGVNYNHVDLKDSMRTWKCMMGWEKFECEHGYDFFHDTTTPLPNEDTHWTHVAWIIAAWINNWKWIIWVNPYAKIVALKVWRSKQFTTADEIKAINFAIENWIKIINASYWARVSSNLEKDAIKRFWEAWWLFVTAAGNDRKMDLDAWYSTYPCKYDLDNILCVAAVDDKWKLAYYSNYWKKSVDVAAPWSEIYSTIITWNVMKNIFSWSFDGCTSGGAVEWWSTWLCFKWKSDYGYWYQFTWTISSPSFDLFGKQDVYISLSLACDSNEWVNVDIQYSTWGWDFVDIERLWLVGQKWSKYTFNVWSDYHSQDFSFRLNAFKNSDLFNDICVIDDVEVYEDPYVMEENDDYWKVSWTSMATPHVAWLASLVRAINPKLTYQQVKSFIMDYWDENESIQGKTVSWKTVNVKKTLDAVVENIVSKPNSLVSSWTWFIQWDVSDDVNNYYYEVLSGDLVVLSWYTDKNWVETNLTWKYWWRVQWLDELWNKSKFSESLICEKPQLHDIYLSWYECSNLKLDLWIDEECMNMYDIVWDNSLMWLESVMNENSILTGKLYIENWFWEKTDEVSVSYVWENSLPTVVINEYSYPTTITNWWEVVIWDLVSIFWAKDGECWSGNINVKAVSCNEWSASLSGNVLKIVAPASKQWSLVCDIEFQDDEWFIATWVFNCSFNTVIKPVSWWGGWWWGWGGWSSVKKTSETDTWKVASEVHNSAENTWDSVKKQELEKPIMRELIEEGEKKSDFDFSRYNNSNPSSLMSNGYSVEFNNAYTFAYKAWITTTNSIEEANMRGKLTRIAMAKMLSNYAINILGKKPANKVVPKFLDVSSQLNEDYGWAVDLAYQLWIMWIWIENFRPNDVVTRWEFATALSRMLYNTSDWNPYYSTHLIKLYQEWIITNSDPKINELRWYVMIMLMRSAKNW